MAGPSTPKSAPHGMYGTRVYRTWNMMIQRCHNERNPNFKHYGGRGIVVCDQWRKSFAAFYADVGDRPEGKSLDRIDNDRGYEPGNCRWATQAEQRRNTRTTKLEAHEPEQIRHLRAEGFSRKQIADFFGVSPRTVLGVENGTIWKEIR